MEPLSETTERTGKKLKLTENMSRDRKPAANLFRQVRRAWQRLVPGLEMVGKPLERQAFNTEAWLGEASLNGGPSERVRVMHREAEIGKKILTRSRRQKCGQNPEVRETIRTGQRAATGKWW